MNYHILTLFPEMVLDGLNTSIIGRAAGKGLLSIEAVNIRDYTKEKHGHVDDTPYGGGAGMVMQAAPVCDAYEALCERIGKRPRVLYMTPQGQTFNQKIAEELAQEEDLVFLCGHYEGIDERALELIVTDYLSVGDYVLTGGELPAMVMIDCISRLVPGVLNNDVSAEIESFHDNLLEYPQYTRPEVTRVCACRRCFFLDTTKTLRPGDVSSLSGGPWRDGRIFWKRQICRRKSASIWQS